MMKMNFHESDKHNCNQLCKQKYCKTYQQCKNDIYETYTVPYVHDGEGKLDVEKHLGNVCVNEH